MAVQNVTQTAHHLWNIARHHPWRTGAVVVGAVVLVSSLVAMVPRTLQFSYAGESCIGKLTLLPQVLQSSSDAYELSVEDSISVGGVPLMGRSICATPVAAPEAGTQAERLSIGGIGFPAHYVRVVTPEAPSVVLASVQKPIAAARPLSLPLSDHDAVFDYVLSSAEREVACQSTEGSLHCEIAELQLAQGEAQPLVLARQFDGQEVATLFDATVEVLPAVVVAESSVSEGNTVYTKNDPFVLTVDKPLVEATARLVRHAG